MPDGLSEQPSSVRTDGWAGGRSIVAHVVGVKFWNRRWLKVLLQHKLGATSVFYTDFDRALQDIESAKGQGDCLLIAWASSLTPQQKRCTIDHNGCFIEDGFIRSVGLGAGLNPGFSFVLDKRGIYYATDQPSDLEYQLQNCSLNQAQLVRGSKLCQALVEHRVSKYNLSDRDHFQAAPAGKKRLVVVGQVQNDASVTSNANPSLNGTQDSNINLALLRVTREASPDAYIVYKPHPDVVSGLRPGAIRPEQIAGLADEVVTDTGILALIDWCHELHTISSLAGFEAVVRGKQVVTHGGPFYAGWGLTRDYCSFPRRSQKLSVEALVYVLLVDYSYHINPVSKELCQPEELISYLASQKNRKWVQLKYRALTLISWIGRKIGL